MPGRFYVFRSTALKILQILLSLLSQNFNLCVRVEPPNHNNYSIKCAKVRMISFYGGKSGRVLYNMLMLRRSIVPHFNANAQKQPYTVGGLDSSASGRVNSGERIGNDAHESRWPANVQTDFTGAERGTAATNCPRRSMGSAEKERRTERRSRFELSTLAHSGARYERRHNESDYHYESLQIF